MSPKEFDALLVGTLADRRLSGSERDLLRHGLADAALDEPKRAVFRSRVFDLAKNQLTDVAAKELLDWVESTLKLLLPEQERRMTQHSEAYFSPGGDCPERIARLFHETRSHADVCVFTITDDRIADAILNAQGRGVTVRIITDNDKAQDLGSDIERLAAAGIPVRIDRTPFHMHHKFALFDGTRLLNGSYNWTLGAARDNLENIVITDDAHLIGTFTGEFERLWRSLA